MRIRIALLVALLTTPALRGADPQIKITPEMEALAKEAQCAVLQAQGEKNPAGCGDAAAAAAKLQQSNKRSPTGGNNRKTLNDELGSDPKTWSLDGLNR